MPEPPPPPGVKSRTLHFASVEIVVAGTVEEFGEAELARISSVVAGAFGVPLGEVSVSLGAASVRLIIHMAASNETAAVALVTKLDETMPSAGSASSLLGVNVTAAPLTELYTEQLLLPLPPSLPPPPLAPPPESTESLFTAAVAVLGVMVALVLFEAIACVKRLLRKKGSKDAEEAAPLHGVEPQEHVARRLEISPSAVQDRNRCSSSWF